MQPSSDRDLALQVQEVTFGYKRNEPVLRDVSLEVERGSVMCILGPSGCGKSTLLKVIAGLRSPAKGYISINGKRQNDVPTFQRNIGFVFQNGALFPHLSVYDNIAFPFRHGNRTAANDHGWNSQVEELLRLVHLEPFRSRSISKLSGGQRQRVSVARALVYRPALLLFDEPLSALDNALRRELLDLFVDLHQKVRNTFVYVTHDEREVRRIGTHIAVIGRDHMLVQTGTVAEVYEKPATQEVANLLDDWNFISSTVVSFESGLATVRMPWGAMVSTRYSGSLTPGAKVTIGLRPCDISVEHSARRVTKNVLRLRLISLHATVHSSLQTCVVVGGEEVVLRIESTVPFTHSVGDTFIGVFEDEAARILD